MEKEGIDQRKKIMNYHWPASKLTKEEMELLYNVRQRTKKTMTLLIKEAIQKMYGNKQFRNLM